MVFCAKTICLPSNTSAMSLLYLFELFSLLNLAFDDMSLISYLLVGDDVTFLYNSYDQNVIIIKLDLKRPFLSLILRNFSLAHNGEFLMALCFQRGIAFQYK